jgi:hypothetical protein
MERAIEQPLNGPLHMDAARTLHQYHVARQQPACEPVTRSLRIWQEYRRDTA